MNLRYSGFFFRLSILALLLAPATNVLAAESVDAKASFEHGLNLYDSSKFKESASSLHSLVTTDQKNGHVIYNMALAYYRSGDFGRSMAAILAARSLMPRDPDVRSNLKFLEARIQDKLSAAPERDAVDRILNFWVGGLSVKEVLTANVVVCFLFALIVLSTFVIQKLKPYRYTGLWLVLAPAITFMLVATKLSLEESWGAIIPDGAKVYSGPGATNTLLFNLNAGAPVQLSGDTNAGFRMVRLSDGKKGWVAEQDLAVF